MLPYTLALLLKISPIGYLLILLDVLLHLLKNQTIFLLRLVHLIHHQIVFLLQHQPLLLIIHVQELIS